MFDLNALMKFINVNNDGCIQKREMTQFSNKIESSSIFSNYFNSITNDTDIASVENDIINTKAANKELTASITVNDKGFFPYNNYSQDIKVIKSIDDIPAGSHDNIKDARFCDISKLNLSEEELLNLCIDKTTVMTPEQKTILKPYREAAKNPGLGIRKLHEQGITGKGVNMAIIDQPLGMHKEYMDNIKDKVHDINAKEMGWNASMHGAAVASIAAGKTVGVAPEAQLDYYSAVNKSNNPDDVKTYKEKIKKEIELNSDNPEYLKYFQEQLLNTNKSNSCPSN